MTFSPPQEILLLVALGSGHRATREHMGHRRYFYSPPGMPTHTLCEELVALGAMTRGTHGFYYVTEEAAASLGITLKP